MKKFVKVFDNGIVWESTGNMEISIPGVSYKKVVVTEMSETDIKKLKEDEKAKIDKKPK